MNVVTKLKYMEVITNPLGPNKALRSLERNEIAVQEPGESKSKKALLGIVGIGNTLVGDDGAGIVIIRRLQTIFGRRKDLFLFELTGDLMEMADLLDRARRFIFVDARIGNNAGAITITDQNSAKAFSPSFHQTDICTVMHSLSALSLIRPFPKWEVWSVEINQPVEFKEELSPLISRAIAPVVDALRIKIKTRLNEK